jgi:hypothetical protein
VSPGRIYWVDRCLGTRLVPEALRAAGIEVRTYPDLYPHDPAVPDERWILDVAARGWVILTKDKAIRRTPAEIDALRRASARYVCLSAKGMVGADQAACLLHHWRTVDSLVASKAPPLIVTVTRISVQWLDGQEWRTARRKR